MSTVKAWAEWDQLLEASHILEAEAGISQVMERAHEGRFMPLGVTGEEVSLDEYFADQHDDFRERARDAYFSVQDVELRKKLIVARRNIDTHIMQSLKTKTLAANNEVSITMEKTKKEPWITAAIIAVCTVAIGYWVFALVGAIAGAIGGFFLGQGTLSETKKNVEIGFKKAAMELEQAQKDEKQRSLWPECFSSSEEITGKRESQLDRESALSNVLSQCR